ncbi:hypothetical protein J5X98_16960 [Leptothermofonsia sichuanensis E412]|uniref:regulatory protein GemA n=1 Tax=Leptothermofonsia sichuanensis TaxID=2917832 RepID=UPI001CA73EB8|nr:regulatory protein GemA [Leptothermofonsia sichuanensis]QZZ19099.1 hypothetical protein J5X98_16960 [Leptothermofonsia sichuanensis E412]
MTQIICLANSWKHGERCIAGIDLMTGNWIRPVSDLSDGRVPWFVRMVDGQEPQLLDILDIPLADTASSHWDFARENHSILPGEWRRVGRLQVTDLLPYCDYRNSILHNPDRCVTVPYLRALPPGDRQTLQLVYAKELSVQGIFKLSGRRKWQATLNGASGHSLVNVTITDPVFVERLETGYRPQHPCLVTVSLSLPFRPAQECEQDEACWKLIAGVIELSEADLVLVEMQRLGWTIQQGRDYLQQVYGKRSRQQLTPTELTDFLQHLQSRSLIS